MESCKHFIQLRSVSASAAMIVAFQIPSDQGKPKISLSLFRLLFVNSFASLYLIFVIIFGVRLHSWDDNVPGACSYTTLLSTSSSKHPYVDEIYLGITSFYFLVGLKSSTREATERLMTALRTRHKPESRQRKFLVTGITLIITGTFPVSIPWNQFDKSEPKESRNPAMEFMADLDEFIS